MSRRWYDPGTIDEVYSPCKGDVLPDFRFPGYWSDATYFSAFEGIDDAGFANVGVSDEAH
jgi:hypothetical protein